MTLLHAAAARACAQFTNAMSGLLEEALSENTVQIERRLQRAGFPQMGAASVPATFLCAEQPSPLTADPAQRGHIEIRLHGATPRVAEQVRGIVGQLRFSR